MSPEQATAERELDARSDIYSLGCVVHEMLAGEPPYTGPTTQAIIAKILTEDAKPLTALRRTVPDQVAAAVAHALEKLPADRFTSAAQFADAMTSAAPVAHALTAAVPSTSAGRVAAVRKPLPWAVVTVAVVGFGWQLLITPLGAPAAVVRFEVTPDSGVRFSTTTGRNVAVSPDGRYVVYRRTPRRDTFRRGAPDGRLETHRGTQLARGGRASDWRGKTLTLLHLPDLDVPVRHPVPVIL
jgi:serine/threonine-protein kinase